MSTSNNTSSITSTAPEAELAESRRAMVALGELWCSDALDAVRYSAPAPGAGHYVVASGGPVMRFATWWFPRALGANVLQECARAARLVGLACDIVECSERESATCAERGYTQLALARWAYDRPHAHYRTPYMFAERLAYWLGCELARRFSVYTQPLHIGNRNCGNADCRTRHYSGALPVQRPITFDGDAGLAQRGGSSGGNVRLLQRDSSERPTAWAAPPAASVDDDDDATAAAANNAAAAASDTNVSGDADDTNDADKTHTNYTLAPPHAQSAMPTLCYVGIELGGAARGVGRCWYRMLLDDAEAFIDGAYRAAGAGSFDTTTSMLLTAPEGLDAATVIEACSGEAGARLRGDIYCVTGTRYWCIDAAAAHGAPSRIDAVLAGDAEARATCSWCGERTHAEKRRPCNLLAHKHQNRKTEIERQERERQQASPASAGE